MIERENVNFIEGTGAALRVYSVKEYIPHFHEDCLEILFLLEGEADILSSYDSFHLAKGDFTVDVYKRQELLWRLKGSWKKRT